jgi:hypothetical protein
MMTYFRFASPTPFERVWVRGLLVSRKDAKALSFTSYELLTAN